jgi:membrane protease YdiL (CAAX protease family)
MKTKAPKGKPIILVILATIVFSIFIKLDSLFSVANTLASRGWSLLPILLVIVLIRMIFAGLVVLIILPLILRSGSWRDWLPGYLRIDRKIVLLGLLSFAVFATLATVISLSMGIFKGDLSAVFAYPDIRPDPDVIGWGYFLLALVPGIWEELAFRGLIQSKLRTAFSISASILLSSLFFGLYHLSNLVTQSPAQALPGVIMAFFFGIGWGYMTVKARSVIPAMISHYLVDSMGQIFLGVNNTDPALATGFFLLLTLLFPIFNIVLTKLVYKQPQVMSKTGVPSYENFQEERT